MRDFELMTAGYGLTLVRVTYPLPDFPSILQEFVWQEYDLYPQFPRVRQFLNYWEREIEVPIRRVELTHQRLIQPSEFRMVDHELRLH